MLITSGTDPNERKRKTGEKQQKERKEQNDIKYKLPLTFEDILKNPLDKGVLSFLTYASGVNLIEGGTKAKIIDENEIKYETKYGILTVKRQRGKIITKFTPFEY
jgi:hypothetical protein